MNEIAIKEIIIAIISGFVSASSVGGIFFFYFRKRITFIYGERKKRIRSERKAMSKFLETWYNRKSPETDMSKFVESIRKTMLWCPNNVLYHIGMYLSLYGKPEAEIHFGKAIICYRKSLGYRNWFWKRVTPEHITTMYAAGNKGKL